MRRRYDRTTTTIRSAADQQQHQLTTGRMTKKRARPPSRQHEGERKLACSSSVAGILFAAIVAILTSSGSAAAASTAGHQITRSTPLSERNRQKQPLTIPDERYSYQKSPVNSESPGLFSDLTYDSTQDVDEVDLLLHVGTKTAAAAAEVGSAASRRLEEDQIITATRQGNAFDVSLSPVLVHLDFRAINRLNSIMDNMMIQNLDTATDEMAIRFSTILLMQEKTKSDGDVPLLTVRILKTAHVTFPSSQADHVPTNESFDLAVSTLFTDLQQRQELVYKLRETKHYAFTSLWDATFAGFVAPPTEEPTHMPTMVPTHHPTPYPSATPSVSPTHRPSQHPSIAPTPLHSAAPSVVPSYVPSNTPTLQPTQRPSNRPSVTPTRIPTLHPSASPTYGFATITVEGNKFDMSLTPMLSPLDFWSTTYLNNALSEMVKRNLVLDFQARVKFTTVLLFQSMKSGDGVQQQGGWRYGNTRALTHKSVKLTSPSASATLIARVQMTAHVTVPTTGDGNYNTHFIPDMDSIDSAVLTVFADPMQKQELVDKLRTSYVRFKQLTDAGFITFVYPPTPMPSAMPSVAPTNLPSLSPSEHPSAYPTEMHSSSPSVSSSESPSQSPSDAPSDRPGDRPSQKPSTFPSVIPTLTHSATPSNVPSAAPTFSAVTVTVRGNVFDLSFSPVSEFLDFLTINTLDLVLDKMVAGNLETIVSGLEQEDITFATSLLNQQVVGTILTARVARTAYFKVPAKAPGVASDNVLVPSGGGIDLATEMVFTDVFQRASLIESLRRSSEAISSDSIFGDLKEINFDKFVYPATPEPTREPSMPPSFRPTDLPSARPSHVPSNQPSVAPTAMPSPSPSSSPTPLHSDYPSSIPTLSPTTSPSASPTYMPSSKPSPSPSTIPSHRPSASPTFNPTKQPTLYPTQRPSYNPTQKPTSHPTVSGSSSPSSTPTTSPTKTPTAPPSLHPTTTAPTAFPTLSPTDHPSSAPSWISESPSQVPSSPPTLKPTYLPITLDVPLSEFTLIFSPMSSYLAQGARDQLNVILDEMIVDNLVLSEELGQVQIEFSTTILSQLTSEDEGKRRKRRKLQQRKPDPTLSVAFQKVAHVTVQTLDLFGNINEEAVPDTASFDLAVLTIFTDLLEKEKFVLSLRNSIGRFLDLRNVVMKDSVSARMRPPLIVKKHSADKSSSSNQIVPGVSNSVFYGIVATVSVIICAVGFVAARMVLSNRNGRGKQKRKVKLSTSRGASLSGRGEGSGRPRSRPSGGRGDRPRSRPRSHHNRRSRSSQRQHRRHGRGHSRRSRDSDQYNNHHHHQPPVMEGFGSATIDQPVGLTMDEGDSVSELEVGESVVANMIKSRSMKEQEDFAPKESGRPPHYPHNQHHNHHHHAPRRSTKRMPAQSHLLEHHQGYSDDWGGDTDDYDAIQAYNSAGHDGWNMDRVESVWEKVDAT